MDKNIIFKHSLEEYNKKYRNRTYRLLKYTKKQVEDFDKQYGHYVYEGKTHSLKFSNYLLKGRKWALIGDTYYEIPRPIRYTWFRNLNAGVQVATCVLGAGVVATAIAVPTIMLNKKQDIKEEERVVIVDSTDVTYSGGFQQDGSIKLKMSAKTAGKIVDEIAVKIGSYNLKEGQFTYDFDLGEIYVYSEIIKAHQGNITFTPTVINEINYDLLFNNNSGTVSPKSGVQLPNNCRIPKTIAGNPVSILQSFASAIQNPNLCLYFPSTITQIGGQYAFAGGNLKKVVLNEGLTKIGDSAFTSCTLEEIVIPSSLSTFEGDAFGGLATTNIVLNNESAIKSTDRYHGLFTKNTNIYASNTYSKPSSGSYIYTNYDEVVSDRPTYTKWTRKS